MKTDWIRQLQEILKHGISAEHKVFARQYATRAKGFIDETMKGMDQEATETREMASSFFRLLSHKLQLDTRTESPTREEVKAAVEQLKDVGRFSVFISAVILPGGVISLVGLELLARKFGITDFTVIPSSFRKRKNNASGNGRDASLPTT
jgi:hypothetical protein